jgi:hypothetical protein
MKNLRNKRDIALVFGVTLLALLPLGIIAYSRRPKAPSNYYSGPIVHPAVLSPDGLYAAAVPQITTRISANSTSTRSSEELVIYRVFDRKEISRTPFNNGSTDTLKWLGGGAYLASSDRSGEVWSRNSLITPGVGTPPTQLSDSDSAANYTYINSDGTNFVNLLIGGGIMAYSIPTSNPIPLRFSWKPKSSRPGMALLPSLTGQNTKKIWAVLCDDWDTAKPTPTPQPTATPTPQPLTAEQKQFLEDQTRAGEEVSSIVERLDSEEEISDEERQRLETRAKALNKQTELDRKRLFPNSQLVSPPVRISQPQSYSRVQFRDLSSGALKWQRKIPTDFFPVHPVFSPDGTKVLLIGAERIQVNAQRNDNGIDILDTRTGRTLHHISVKNMGFSDEDILHFYTNSKQMIAFTDFDKNGYFLRHIDLSTGRDAASWSLKSLKPLGIESLQDFSCDATGMKWSFSIKEDWKVFNRAEIEAQNKIQATVTSSP